MLLLVTTDYIAHSHHKPFPSPPRGNRLGAHYAGGKLVRACKITRLLNLEEVEEKCVYSLMSYLNIL